MVDVENWQKLDNSNIFINGFTVAIYKDLSRSWFKCSNIGLVLSVTLKFNDIVTIVLNVKARRGLYFAFAELPKFREKLIGNRDEK